MLLQTLLREVLQQEELRGLIQADQPFNQRIFKVPVIMKTLLRIVGMIIAILWIWYQAELIYQLRQTNLGLMQELVQCNENYRIVYN